MNHDGRDVFAVNYEYKATLFARAYQHGVEVASEICVNHAQRSSNLLITATVHQSHNYFVFHQGFLAVRSSLRKASSNTSVVVVPSSIS